MSWYTISWLSPSILGWLLFFLFRLWPDENFLFLELLLKTPAYFSPWTRIIRVHFSIFSWLVLSDTRRVFETLLSPGWAWWRHGAGRLEEPPGCPGPWLVYSEAWALLDTFTQAKHITLLFRLFLLAGDDIYSEIIFAWISFLWCSLY